MENMENKIVTIVKCEDVPSFFQKLKKNGLLIYEEELNLSEDIQLVYNPSFVKDDRRYDIVATNLKKRSKKSDVINILTNIDFQECFIKSKNLLLSLTADEKEQIQKKADNFNLSISDLLYFVGTNINGLEKSEAVLTKRKVSLKGVPKTTISLRVSSIDKEFFSQKANKYNMNVSEFFVISALNFEFKLIIPEKKGKRNA